MILIHLIDLARPDGQYRAWTVVRAEQYEAVGDRDRVAADLALTLLRSGVPDQAVKVRALGDGKIIRYLSLFALAAAVPEGRVRREGRRKRARGG